MTLPSEQPPALRPTPNLVTILLFAFAILLGAAALAIFMHQGDFRWSRRFTPGVIASFGLAAVGTGVWLRSNLALAPFICGFFALLCIVLGFFGEILAVVWFWISAWMLGALIAPFQKGETATPRSVVIQFALGFSFMNLIIALSIYSVGLGSALIFTLSGLISIGVWLRHRSVDVSLLLQDVLRRDNEPTPLLESIAVFGVMGVLSMLVLVGSFPDAGSDSISAYRSMLKQIQVTGRLDYSPENSILRLQPIFGIWTQAYAVVLSDSYSAAKVFNSSLLIAAASLVLATTRHRLAACLAVIVSFSLPLLIYTTISGFYDNAMVFLGVLFIALSIGVRGTDGNDRITNSKSTLVALGVLSSVLMLTKLTSLYAVPGFVLFFVIMRWQSGERLTKLLADAALIGAVAAVPVLIFCVFVWVETGNPIFPYYNAMFESPYFDIRNFKSPHTGYVSWRMVLDMTFDTARYAQRGAIDGQLGLMMISGLFAALAISVKRSRLLVASIASFFVIVFFMSAFQNSARYMTIALPFLAFAMAEIFRSDLRWAASCAAIALALPNWAMLPKFGYTAVDFSTVWKSNHTDYIRRFVPVSRLTDKLSIDFGPFGRVLFAERNGGFVGKSFETGWYDNATFRRYGKLDHTDPESVKAFISQNRIDAVVVNHAGLNFLVRYDRLAFLENLENMSETTEIINGVRLYRIDPVLSHKSAATIEPQTMMERGSFLETNATESLRATLTYRCSGTVFIYATELVGRRRQNSARSPLICNETTQIHTIAARPSTLKKYDGVNLYTDIRKNSELDIFSGEAFWR